MSLEKNRVRALELAAALHAFANEAAASSDDDASQLLLAVVRDSAAQIRRAATAVGTRPAAAAQGLPAPAADKGVGPRQEEFNNQFEGSGRFSDRSGRRQ
jgi:hypothetical protein